MDYSTYVPVSLVREIFKEKLHREEFVTDKTGVKTIEWVGASLIADEDTIFGPVNWDYVDREIRWYESCSLNVADIPDKTPAIWQQVADEDGFINSNYGWCVFHPDNYMQYQAVKEQLIENKDSRRAIMIYTRPNMHLDYNYKGRSDFMCTNAHQYVIRNDKLHVIVQMRSNDVVFGYRNDRAWADYVLTKLANDLELDKGDIYWQVGSLHIYERDFWRIESFAQTGKQLTKKEWNNVLDSEKL